MQNLTLQIKSTRAQMLEGLNEWLDPSILQALQSNENQLFYISADDVPDVKNYKALLNTLTSLSNLSERFSSQAFLQLISDLKHLNSTSLKNIQQHLSYIFNANPTLFQAFCSSISSVQNYLSNSETLLGPSVQATPIITSDNFITTVKKNMEGLKQIETEGLDPILAEIKLPTAKDLAGHLNRIHSNLLKNFSEKLQLSLEDLSNTNGQEQTTLGADDEATVKAKLLLNSLKAAENIFLEAARMNSLNTIPALANMVSHIKTIVGILKQLNPDQETRKQASSLLKLLQQSMFEFNHILRDLAIAIDTIELSASLKQGKLFDLVDPIFNTYNELAEILELDFSATEQYPYLTSRSEAFEERYTELSQELETAKQQQVQRNELLNKLCDIFEEINVKGLSDIKADKVLFIKNNLNILELESTLRNKYEAELNDELRARAKIIDGIFEINKDIEIVNFSTGQLYFIQQNQDCLPKPLTAKQDQCLAKLDQILESRKAIAKEYYQEYFQQPATQLDSISHEKLTFFKEHLPLLALNEKELTDCLSAIKQFEQAEITKQTSSWTGWFGSKMQSGMQIMGSAAAAGFSLAQSASTLLMTGSGLLTQAQVQQRLEQKFTEQTTQIAHLEQQRTLCGHRKKTFAILSKNHGSNHLIRKIKPAQAEIVSSESIPSATKNPELSPSTQPPAIIQNVAKQATINRQEIARQLYSAHTRLLGKLTDWLMEEISQKLQKTDEADKLYYIVKDDPAAIKNYKILLNTILLAANLAEEFSLSKLMELANNLKQLDTSYIYELIPQLKLILSTNPQLAQTITQTIANIENLFESDWLPNMDTSSQSIHFDLLGVFKNGITFLKKIEEEGLKPILEESNLPFAGNMAEHLKDTHGFLLSHLTENMQQINFKPDNSGRLSVDNREDIQISRIKSSLNIIKSAERIFLKVNNMSGLNTLPHLASIVSSIKDIIDAIKKINLTAASKEYAAKLRSALREVITEIADVLQKAAIMLDYLEANFDLKPGKLISLLEDSFKAHGELAKILEIRLRTDMQWPYTTSRKKSLFDYGVELSNNLSTALDKKHEVEKLLTILESIRSNGIASSKVDDILYLQNNLNKLDLDSHLQKKYETELQSELKTRIKIIEEIFEANKALATSDFSTSQLYFIQQNQICLPKPLTAKQDQCLAELSEVLEDRRVLAKTYYKNIFEQTPPKLEQASATEIAFIKENLSLLNLNRAQTDICLAAITQFEQKQTNNWTGWLHHKAQTGANILGKAASSTINLIENIKTETNLSTQGQVYNHTISKLSTLTGDIETLTKRKGFNVQRLTHLNQLKEKVEDEKKLSSISTDVTPLSYTADTTKLMEDTNIIIETVNKLKDIVINFVDKIAQAIPFSKDSKEYSLPASLSKIMQSFSMRPRPTTKNQQVPQQEKLLEVKLQPVSKNLVNSRTHIIDKSQEAVATYRINI